MFQLLTAVIAVVIGATAAGTTGGAENKEGRFRAEKSNRSSLFKNVPAEVNTFIANTHASKSCGEVFYLMLLFAAERAASIDHVFWFLTL